MLFTNTITDSTRYNADGSLTEQRSTRTTDAMNLAPWVCHPWKRVSHTRDEILLTIRGLGFSNQDLVPALSPVSLSSFSVSEFDLLDLGQNSHCGVWSMFLPSVPLVNLLAARF